jgi:hypothetical protein
LATSAIIDFQNPHQYYYSLLSNEQRVIYGLILEGIRAFADGIKIPQTSSSAISTMWNYILLDNPLIFYTRNYVQIMDSQGNVETVKPTYDLPRQVIKQNVNEIIRYLMKFNSIMSKSEMDKELAIHDHCLATFKYDYSFGSNAYSVLGAIQSKTAVCEGISKFVKLAFDYVGMKSLVAIGDLKKPIGTTTTNGHAWNIVELGGKPYHLDVTLDMTMMDKVKRYDYYNLSDRDIQRDHIILSNVPACKTYGYDYFSQHSLNMNNFEALERHLLHRIKKGERVIVVRMEFRNNITNIESAIMEIAKRQYANIYNHAFEIEMISNKDQMVFEIHYKP